VGIAQGLVDTTEWSRYELRDGPASEFGNALSAFIADTPVDQGPALWATMENHVFSQDDIFSAAEPTLRVLLAALVDGDDASARLSILELIFHIVQAASYRDDDLGARCVDEAAAANWLLVREAVKGDQNVAASCIEILDITSPEYAELVRATRRIAAVTAECHGVESSSSARFGSLSGTGNASCGSRIPAG
jgi:hypothetical protein